jgi:hypothetical protein
MMLQMQGTSKFSLVSVAPKDAQSTSSERTSRQWEVLEVLSENRYPGPGELSTRKGQIAVILDRNPPQTGFFQCRIAGNTGLVPARFDFLSMTRWPNFNV